MPLLNPNRTLLLALCATVGLVFSGGQAPGQEVKPVVKLKLKGHRDGVAAIAFSGKGDLIATADKDGVIRVWEVKTGKQLPNIPALDLGSVSELYFFDPSSRNRGELFARCAKGTALLELGTADRWHPFPADADKQPVSAIIFTDSKRVSGRYVLVNTPEKKEYPTIARVYDSGTRKFTDIKYVTKLSDAQEKRITAIFKDRTLSTEEQFDSALAIRKAATIPPQFTPYTYAIAATRDGATVAAYGVRTEQKQISGESDGQVVLFDGHRDPVPLFYTFDNPPRNNRPRVAYSEDAKWFGVFGKWAQIWRGSPRNAMSKPDYTTPLVDVAIFGPDNLLVYASKSDRGSTDPIFRTEDITSKVIVAKLGGQDTKTLLEFPTESIGVECVAISYNADLLAISSGYSGVVQVWELPKLK